MQSYKMTSAHIDKWTKNIIKEQKKYGKQMCTRKHSRTHTCREREREMLKRKPMPASI